MGPPEEQPIQPERDPHLIDLRDFSSLLRRRKLSITLVTLLITALAVGFVAWRAPVYTSVAQVEVRPLTIDEEFQPSAADSVANMDTEAARVTQEPVASLAAPALGLKPGSPDDLAEAADGVDVTVQANTTFLQISCTEEGPALARTCASAFASAYVDDRVNNASNLYEERVATEQAKIQQANDRVEQLSEQLDQLTSDQDAARSTIRAQIDAQSQLIAAASTYVLSLPTASPNAAVLARSAELPTGPSNKDFLFTGVLAVMLGLALGIGFAFVRERIAEPIATGLDLEQILDAPALAAVPALPARPYRNRRVLVTTHAPASPASQAYRGAAAGLLHHAREGPLKVIAVTGPGEGEGKTAATGNLAVALAQSGSRVVAVSCDLRNPSLHTYLDRSNVVGVTSVLKDPFSLDEALQVTDEPNLVVLATGPLADDPTELLSSEGFLRLLAELRMRFDFVLLDAGPSLVADVLFLVPHSDGVIVVADATKTSRDSIAHLRHRMTSVGGRILGGILHNRAPMRADRASPYHAPILPSTPHSKGSVGDQAGASSGQPRPHADVSRSTKAAPAQAGTEPKASTPASRPNMKERR